MQENETVEIYLSGANTFSTLAKNYKADTKYTVSAADWEVMQETINLTNGQKMFGLWADRPVEKTSEGDISLNDARVAGLYEDIDTGLGQSSEVNLDNIPDGADLSDLDEPEPVVEPVVAAEPAAEPVVVVEEAQPTPAPEVAPETAPETPADTPAPEVKATKVISVGKGNKSVSV